MELYEEVKGWLNLSEEELKRLQRNKSRICLQEVGSWLGRTNSQILYEVYLRRYAKYTRNKASFLVMITNRFSPQTQRSHCENKVVARANRTTKDNLGSLIKENNSPPNHWCHYLGELLVKKHNHSQNNCQNAVWSGFRNLSEKRNQKGTNEWTSDSYIKLIQSRRMVNNLKNWMSQTLKESGVWHMQNADRGLQSNPKSQVLKASRSKKWVLRLKYCLSTLFEMGA